jgi:tetratricopeptide (TPR) repeat protein
MRILIRLDEKEKVWAEELTGNLARLLEIPLSASANVYDVVRYSPYSIKPETDGASYALEAIEEPSGYRAYLTWAVLHKPKEFERWREGMEAEGIVIEPAAWITDTVRNLIIAGPPYVSSLETLARFNRHSPTVEIICPLLAAHADDLDRAKSDLDRAVGWGGPDPELTFAIAEAFEEAQRWDEAAGFWERLVNALPNLSAARERLAVSYARLGVFIMAANEFDRAAELSEDAEHRRRLVAARDLMVERSKV